MTALIIVDLQNDFLPGGALPAPSGNTVIPVINKLLNHPFDLIVGTADDHPTDHVSFAASHGKQVNEVISAHGRKQILWPVHCVHGTPGAEYADKINQKKIKKIFRKGTKKDWDSYSGFFDDGLQSTGLHEYLQSKGIKEIYLVGLTTEYCVKHTALDGAKLGYTVYLILDGCKAINSSPHDEEYAIQEMLQAGVNVIQELSD